MAELFVPEFVFFDEYEKWFHMTERIKQKYQFSVKMYIQKATQKFLLYEKSNTSKRIRAKKK